MTRLTLELSDGIITELRNTVITKGMVGSLYGIGDEFLTRIVKAIEDGEETVSFVLKREQEADDQAP